MRGNRARNSRSGRPFRLTMRLLSVCAVAAALAVACPPGIDARYRYRGATIEPDGALGAPFWLSASDVDATNFPALAANERGQVVFAWEQHHPSAAGGPGRTEVVARAGTADGTFGPPAVLTPPDRSADVSLHASVAPTGRASVLWPDRPAGAPPADPQGSGTWVSHLDASGAAPPVPIPYAASPPPPLLRERRPPLREARLSGRTARAGAGGRVRVRVRCRSWITLPCRGTVRLDGAERRSFSVPAGSGARVVVRLRRTARRALARRGRLRLSARVRTAGPRGGAQRRTVVIRR